MIAVFLAVLAMTPPAQAARDVRVTVTVVDQTGAVIPNAKVTVIPAGAQLPPPGTPPAATPAAPGREPVTTNEKGIATIGGLAPGRFNIVAEFPGFEPRTLRDI